MTIVGEEKPSLNDLTHHGVLGMKWGHRQAATGKQILQARKNLKKQAADYRQEAKKLKTTTDSSQHAALEKRLRAAHVAYLKNPDRVIAARMTRGEKLVSGLLASNPSAPIISIATSSAVSRRIEYKQETGAYDHMKPGKVKKSIGFQRGRRLALDGLSASPSLLKTLGSTAMPLIAQKAAANRAAALVVKPKAIGSAAAKIGYAKARRGAYKITTM